MQGRVVSPADRPRSYVLECPTGRVERNRSQLQVIPDAGGIESEQQDEVEHENENVVPSEPPSRIMTRSRMDTAILRPERLVQQV